jgi:hypothetical protein
VAVFEVTHLRTIRRDQQFSASGVESTAFGFPFDQFDQHRVGDRRQPQPRPFRQPRINQPRIGHAVAAVVVSVVVGVGPASHAATVHEHEFAVQHMFEYSLHASSASRTVTTRAGRWEHGRDSSQPAAADEADGPRDRHPNASAHEPGPVSRDKLLAAATHLGAIEAQFADERGTSSGR